MNLGLGNLDDLKQFILAEAIREQTDKDAVLQVIGKGVAASFERYCNRWFDRVDGAVDTFTADRDTWNLSRSPVEEISSVQTKSSDAEGWVAQEGLVQMSILDRGFLDFGGLVADYRTHVRVTYVGGFYFETLEPADEGYPTEQPEGSTPVPADLKYVWLCQCQAVFEAKDHLLPKGISADGATTIPMNLKDVPMLPQVVEILNTYRRFQIT